MVKFYAKKKKGMLRAKSGKYYYPRRRKQIVPARKFRSRAIITRQPFPNVTKRVLTYAFRDQIQPPTTSQGGFSCASIRYTINYPYDIDPAAGTLSTSARRNHQPMGYDQLEALYDKQRVDWVKLRINFAMEKPAVTYTETMADAGGGNMLTQGTQFSSVPLRVALLITKESSLPTSLLTVNQNTVSFEKLIEMSRSGLLPAGSALSYKTMHHDQIVKLSKGVNLFKFFKRHDNKTWSDWVEDNSRGFNGSPSNLLYCHIICSPISVTPNDNHPKVTFYGDMSLGMTFSDLKTFGQS